MHMECRSVLVVDEDKDVRDTLQEALEEHGYVVHTATNSQEALNFLGSLSKNAIPGCIILDLAMPIVNGPEFLKRIETDYKDEFGEIPIITTSANLNYVDPSSIGQDARSIKKPLNLNVLYDAIEHHCRWSM